MFNHLTEDKVSICSKIYHLQAFHFSQMNYSVGWACNLKMGITKQPLHNTQLTTV